LADGSACQQLPIIKDGRAVWRLSLGEVEKALGSPLPQLQEFGSFYRFDLGALKKLIQETSHYRNTAAHETRMSFVAAWKLRDGWLGVNTRDGGIFGVLRRPTDSRELPRGPESCSPSRSATTAAGAAGHPLKPGLAER
jgi:hypothetical protein